MIGRTNAVAGGGRQVTLTLLGAPGEKVSWSGDGYATLGADGSTVVQLDRGSYIFTGGVSGYSTGLIAVQRDGVVYVRPEKAAYWYGAKIAGDWVQMASATITYNANSMVITTRRTGDEGAWVGDVFSGAAKVRALITKGDNILNNLVTLHARDKWGNSGQNETTTQESVSGKIRLTRAVDAEEMQGYGVHFLSSSSGVYSTVTVHALWAE